VKKELSFGIPPLPLNAQQTLQLCEMLKNPPDELKEELMNDLSDIYK
jgi:aconitate hydratase 2/2-methylisocitrate dehydratase